MARFDEIELIREPNPEEAEQSAVVTEFPVRSAPVRIRTAIEDAAPARPASLINRFLGLLTDASLFVALALALSPLLPPGSAFGAAALPSSAMVLFVLLLSYYYFVLCWLIWGRTVGGSIFETRVVPLGTEAMDFSSASKRWIGTILSILTAGLGFVPAALPGHRSLADRMSGTRCVAEEVES